MSTNTNVQPAQPAPVTPGDGRAGKASASVPPGLESTDVETNGRVFALVLGLVCGLFLAPTALGFSAAPVALPALAAQLHLGAGSTAWVLAGYSLSTAVMTALSGRIADLHGLRPPLFIAAAVLLAGTVLTLLGASLGAVIAGRVVQGAGAGAAGVLAFRLPAARLSDTALRGRAIGTLGLVVGLCSGAGALFGGLLTQHLSWRWALALPGLSVLIAPALLGVFPRNEAKQIGRLDLPGALLCALAIAALTVLIQAHATGLSVGWALLAGLLCLAAIGLLVAHQRRHASGFLPRALGANARFRLAAGAGFTLFAGYLIMQFAAPLLLLAHERLSATQIGLILLPAGLASATISRLAGGLIARTGPWPIVITLASASTAGLLLAASVPNSPAVVVIALAACVSGFSAGQVTLMAALPDIVDPDIQGISVGVFQLVFITGGSVGAAAIGALISAISLRDALAALAALPAVGIVLAILARQGKARRPPAARARDHRPE